MPLSRLRRDAKNAARVVSWKGVAPDVQGWLGQTSILKGATAWVIGMTS